jgi:hypothetical protein
MPHARAAEAVGLATMVQPHVGVGMSDALACIAVAALEAGRLSGDEPMAACCAKYTAAANASMRPVDAADRQDE